MQNFLNIHVYLGQWNIKCYWHPLQVLPDIEWHFSPPHPNPYHQNFWSQNFCHPVCFADVKTTCSYLLSPTSIGIMLLSEII